MLMLIKHVYIYIYKMLMISIELESPQQLFGRSSYATCYTPVYHVSTTPGSQEEKRWQINRRLLRRAAGVEKSERRRIAPKLIPFL